MQGYYALGGAAENLFEAPLRRVERKRRAAFLAALIIVLFLAFSIVPDELERLERDFPTFPTTLRKARYSFTLGR